MSLRGSASWMVLAVVLAACGGGDGGGGGASNEAGTQSPGGPAGDVIPVQVAPVRIEPLSEIYSTSTTLRADRTATVIARTQGVIRKLVVEEGDRVAEGAVLAVLEDDEQIIEYDRTRANMDIEAKELARAEQLFGEELLSFEDFETARREKEEASHAFARAELELARTKIRAPFAGTILTRHLDSGATVGDGTAVYDLADLDPLYADVQIPERHVARLAPGQSVRMVADANRDVVDAIIERIAPAVDPATGTVKVTLAVRPGPRLRPGAFVRARIVTATHDAALVVPRSALVAEGRRWHVYRLQPDGTAVEQLEVALGFEEGDRVEIAGLAGAAAALSPGDHVVVVGAPALTDGSSVEVVDPASDEEHVDEPA